MCICSAWSTGCLIIIKSLDGGRILKKRFKNVIVEISLSPTERFLIVSEKLCPVVSILDYASLTKLFEIKVSSTVKVKSSTECVINYAAIYIIWFLINFERSV